MRTERTRTAVTVSCWDDAALLVVDGDVAAEGAVALRRAVEEALAAGAGRVVVDLGAAGYTGSACLYVLETTANRVPVVVVGAPPALRRMAAILDVHGAVDFRDW